MTAVGDDQSAMVGYDAVMNEFGLFYSRIC
jgi:hypothetical protein